MKEEESSTPRLSLLSNPWEVEVEAEAQGMKTPPLIPPHSIAIPFKWEEIPGKPIQSPRNHALTHSRSLHLPPRLQPLHSTSMRRSCSSYSASHPPLCLIHHWTPTTNELLAQPCSLSYPSRSPSPTLGKKGIFIKMKRTSALFATILNRIRLRISLKKGR